jgi:cell division protein FtsX
MAKEKKEEEFVELKLPSLKNLKKGTWMTLTFVFAVLAIAAIVLLAVLYFGGNPTTSSTKALPANQVGQNIVTFLNSHTNSTIQLENVTEISGVYEINVLYQGQSIPVYATKDGQYLLQTIVPVK